MGTEELFPWQVRDMSLEVTISFLIGLLRRCRHVTIVDLSQIISTKNRLLISVDGISNTHPPLTLP